MKETVMNALKRIARLFNGTKECHAKLDQAVKRSEEVRERAQSFCETIEIEKPQAHPVTNGASR